jgi:thioredoxin 1
MVKVVESKEEFDSILRQNPLVLVDFTAAWCGPCKQIAPVYEQFSKKYPKITAIKVDVDQLKDVAQEYGISAMPTFKVFLQSREINEMRGADRNGLENLFKGSIDLYETKLKELEEKKKVSESYDELMLKSVKELKAMLQDRGISLSGLSEKQDLAKKLKGLL